MALTKQILREHSYLVQTSTFGASPPGALPGASIRVRTEPKGTQNWYLAVTLRITHRCEMMRQKTEAPPTAHTLLVSVDVRPSIVYVIELYFRLIGS